MPKKDCASIRVKTFLDFMSLPVKLSSLLLSGRGESRDFLISVMSSFVICQLFCQCVLKHDVVDIYTGGVLLPTKHAD